MRKESASNATRTLAKTADGEPSKSSEPSPHLQSERTRRGAGGRARDDLTQLVLGWCNKTFSHGGPIGRRKRGYILTADRSDAES
eukprot:380176-Prorocentrum_minimum.AAC.1